MTSYSPQVDTPFLNELIKSPSDHTSDNYLDMQILITIANHQKKGQNGAPGPRRQGFLPINEIWKRIDANIGDLYFHLLDMEGQGLLQLSNDQGLQSDHPDFVGNHSYFRLTYQGLERLLVYNSPEIVEPIPYSGSPEHSIMTYFAKHGGRKEREPWHLESDEDKLADNGYRRATSIANFTGLDVLQVYFILEDLVQNEILDRVVESSNKTVQSWYRVRLPDDSRLRLAE